MKLYFSPGACSMASHIVAREAGIELDIEKVNLGTKVTASGADYNAINPKGYVPALALDNGTLLTEGPAIMQFLADQAPVAKLVPANGSFERYQLMEMLNFISTEIHKNYSPLFRPNSSEDVRTNAMAAISRRYDLLEVTLGKQDYLLGSQFTVADAYLFTVTNWAGMVKLDLAKWPKLQAYVARIAQRPAVQAAMGAEGLLK